MRTPRVPRLDGRPRRAVTSVNLRHEEKKVFDVLHSWWSLQRGERLKQWDAFSILMAYALANPACDIPDGLVERPREPL